MADAQQYQRRDGLVEKVRTWLDDQGYPLEMRVARTFRKAGFNVAQSVCTFDRKSDRPFEIDVLAKKDVSLTDRAICVSIVIECKDPKKEKPWLLFQPDKGVSDDTDWFLFPKCAVSSLNGKQCAAIKNSEKARALSFLNSGQLGGYGLRQAFVEEEDRAYRVMRTLTQATTSVTCISDALNERGFKIFEIAVPILVTTAPILAVRLEANNNIEIEQIAHGVLSWQHVPRMLVHIVNESSLEAFSKSLYSECDEFVRIATEALRAT
jgi:hypothetical protein